ncbi:NAD(P)H-binding protein [Campylobacter sp. RM15925]|uniref:NAD(P)H-binding protein n=1 Tax=Campylobacter sp. RM15925 TaxID=1705724 RepID=UPI00147565F1|nr:NAD(P)H-binding protein [Campylobacter sp. RM15925]
MSGYKTALVVGATGVVGREIVRQLCEDEDYLRVFVWTRRDLDFAHEKLDVKKIDFDKISEIKLFYVDEIYCALGTTLRKARSKERFLKVDVEYVTEVAKWGKLSGAKSFSMISSLKADVNSGVFYFRAKGEAENAVKELGYDSLMIFHPSLIKGQREEFRVFENFMITMFKLIPKNFFSSMRPMSGKQIAQAVLKVAKNPPAGAKIYRPQDVIKTNG